MAKWVQENILTVGPAGGVLVVEARTSRRRGHNADVPVELAAAAATPGPGEDRQGRPTGPTRHRAAGVGPGTPCRADRGDPRRDAANALQLEGAVRSRRCARCSAGSRRPRTAHRVDRGGAALPGMELAAAARSAGIRVGGLDGGAAAAPPGEVDGCRRFRHDAPRAVASARLRVEASPVRVAARHGPREKNAEFAGKSVAFRNGLS
jgi:hypothetical protein